MGLFNDVKRLFEIKKVYRAQKAYKRSEKKYLKKMKAKPTHFGVKISSLGKAEYNRNTERYHKLKRNYINKHSSYF